MNRSSQQKLAVAAAALVVAVGMAWALRSEEPALPTERAPRSAAGGAPTTPDPAAGVDETFDPEDLGAASTDAAPEGSDDRPRPPRASEEAAGEIQGEVLDLDGHPVAGATVAAIEPESRLAVASTTTDASGRFQLRGLDAGRFQVSAEAQGFGSGMESVEVPAGGPLRFLLTAVRAVRGQVVDPSGAPVGPGLAVFVNGRRWGVTDADGAFELVELDVDESLALSAQGAGRVSAEPTLVQPGRVDADGIRVIVVDGVSLEVAVHGGGGPLEGVNLRALEPQRGDSLGYEQTGANGEGVLGSLPLGRVVLRAALDGWRAEEQELVLSAAVTRVTLELTRGASLRGRVLVSGVGVEGARLALARVDELDGEQPEEEMLTAESEPDGTYAFSGLEGGTYRLRLYLQPDDPSVRSVRRVARATLAADEERVIDVHLPEPESTGSVRGVVQGAAPGVKVEAWQTTEEGVEAMRTVTWTLEGGRYLIEGLSAGEYELTAADGEPTRVVVNAGRVSELNVDLSR